MSAPLSAVQILYSGINRGQIGGTYQQAACRICGGPLLLPYKPLVKLSESWTDENLCRRRDSDKICAACSWFTEGKNRSGIWSARPVIYASANESANMTVPELHRFLQKPFAVPAVIIVRGRDISLTRKHIQWRAIDAVTWSRERLNILYYGLQLWKDGSKITGTAVTSASRITGLADMMCKESFEPAKKFSIEYQEKKKNGPTAWTLQNFVFENLLRALNEDMTPEIYLAAYIASHLVSEKIIEEGVA